jgi:hypothetical protein
MLLATEFECIHIFNFVKQTIESIHWFKTKSFTLSTKLSFSLIKINTISIAEHRGAKK